MRPFLRRLRGLVGTAATWGIAWFGVAAVFFGLRTLGALPIGMVLFSAAGVGAAGFLAGAGFSAVLMLAERKKSFRELSMLRMTGLGFVGSVLAGLPFLLELSGGPLFSALGLLGVLGAMSSSGTLKVARLSDENGVLNSGEHVHGQLPGAGTSRMPTAVS